MTASDLTEHRLADGPNLDDPADAEAWRIENDRMAAWAFLTRAEAQAELDRIQANHAEQTAIIDQWAADKSRPHLDTVARMDGYLIGYRLRLKDENPKLPKSYPVPGGAITRTKARTKVTFTDEAAFLAWAEA